ncbi:MAG TPA: FG-GAP-like repeat-containing protein, partial [Pyrinomonadaceae bacterium]|nr:FG-GAP-like repeat-containing protein [Pyrinomonadaceae bacterium]
MSTRLTSSSLLVAAVIVILIGVLHIGAQSGVDTTYNGVPAVSLIPGSGVPSVFRQAVQADGKILVWGGALAIEGVAKGRLARLNSDGTLDAGFSYCECGIDFLNNAAPLPDGKILVAGSSNGVGAKVVRLNSNGTLDASFNYAPSITGGSASASIVAVQPDGRFFVTRTWSSLGFSAIQLYHFNADGSQDQSFATVDIGSGSPNFSSLGAIEVLPDGRIYVAVNTFAPFSQFTNLKRYTTAGIADATWESPTFEPSNGRSIHGLDIDTNGNLLVAGVFQQVNGFSRANLVRLMPAGNLDLAFVPPAVFQGSGVRALSNGKILYSFTPALGDGVRMMRLNTEGSEDNTYAMEPGLTMANPWVIDASDRVIFLSSGLKRLLVDGARDSAFDPIIGHYGRAHVLARQADGKVIVAGEFTTFNGVTTIPLVRTNADGTLDATYNTGTGFSAIPRKMVVQSDGKLLAIGSFTEYNGTPVPGIVRLMSDGTVDPLFSVIPNSGAEFYGLTLLPDGRFYLLGNFSTINGSGRAGVARLHTDGTLDQGFNALLGGTPAVYDAASHTDGKVVIGGSFSGVGGFNRSNLARLESSGALDQTFTASSVGAVNRVWLRPDGKYWIAGQSGSPISRRNSDGSADNTFASLTFENTSSGSVTPIEALPRDDGSIIVGGGFNRVGTTNRTGVVRLTPVGTVDPLFLPNSADGRVRSIIDGGDGKVLIGGDFTRIENTTKPGLARLNVEPFRKVALFDFDGDGRSDFSVFRPSTNRWYTLQTSNWQYKEDYFGSNGDIIAPADFDGDGKTD